MYKLITTKQFEKDLKKCIKRGYPMAEFKTVVNLLVQEGCLPLKYKPHKLSGSKAGNWECHIRRDWLLVWQQNDTELVLVLISTGTHSDLF